MHPLGQDTTHLHHQLTTIMAGLAMLRGWFPKRIITEYERQHVVQLFPQVPDELSFIVCLYFSSHVYCYFTLFLRITVSFSKPVYLILD